MTNDILAKQQVEDNELLEEVIRSKLMRLDSSLVGVVTSVNMSLNTVDVQPVIMRKMRGQDPRPLAIIKNCPIKFYGAGGFVITFIPKIGDVCDLAVNDRSLDVWKKKGGIVDSGMSRIHDMVDAKAYFGLNNYGNAYQSIQDGMEIRTRDGNTGLLVKNGSIEFKVGNTVVAVMSSGSITFNVPVSGPSGTFGGKVVETHTHGGVQAGGDQTGVPT